MRDMRVCSTAILFALAIASTFLASAQEQHIVRGQAAFADWDQQQPGVRRKITVADLPSSAPEEAVNNTPHFDCSPKGCQADCSTRFRGRALRRRRRYSHAAR